MLVYYVLSVYTIYIKTNVLRVQKNVHLPQTNVTQKRRGREERKKRLRLFLEIGLGKVKMLSVYL